MYHNRSHRRFQCSGNVILESKDGYRFEGVVVDAGEGGFRVCAGYPVEVSTTVGFSLVMPQTNKSIQGSGIVRHRRVAQAKGIMLCTFGIEFTLGDSKVAQKLIAILTRRRSVKSFIPSAVIRELSFVFKMLPLVVLIVWGIFSSLSILDNTMRHEKEKDDLLFDALVTGLYQMH